MDQTKRPTIHANFRHLRPLPTTLDRALETSHLPHHQILTLKVTSSTAKTNNPHPCASIAHASTINPSSKHSKILPSLNKYHKIQLPSFHHLLRPCKNNTGSPITGQLVTVDNYLRATSWQNERKTFGVADPSSPLWRLPVSSHA